MLLSTHFCLSNITFWGKQNCVLFNYILRREIYGRYDIEREGKFLCFVTPCRHVAYDKSRYWDNRKTRRSLYQFLPPSFLSVSSSILIYCHSPTLCMCMFVCVCSPISCHPYLLGDKLHHALSRLCILQRIRRLLAQCFVCALYDQFCRMNIRESTLVATE